MDSTDNSSEGDDYALENQVPMSSAQFMELLKAGVTSPKHLQHADTPHPFSPFSPQPEEPSPLASNPPSPFNNGDTASTSTLPPRSILHDRGLQKLSPVLSISSDEEARAGAAMTSSFKKNKEPPSPFKQLSIHAMSPQTSAKSYESENSVHYDLNDLVFTPSPVKNGGSEGNENPATIELHVGEENENELPDNALSALTSQATFMREQSEGEGESEDDGGEEQNLTLPPETTSITYEPPARERNAWGSLRILSLLMRPFRESARARNHFNSDASSNLSDVDDNDESGSLAGDQLESSLDKNKVTQMLSKVGLTKKRRESLKDVAARANTKHKQDLEFEELQNSVGQFRNPMFETKLSIATSARMKSGIYKSKSRLKKNAIVPDDIMNITQEMSIIENSNVMTEQTSIKPHFREKPTNCTEWVLDSDSKTFQHFYLFIIFIILAEACVLPFQFVFYEKGGNEDSPYSYKVYHFLVTLCYILDLYISFHLTFVDKKSEVIVDLSMISQHYVASSEFKFDIVSAIPFDFFGLFIDDFWWWTTYIKLFKTFRLLNLKKMKRLSDNQTIINIGRIMWVLVLFVVVMHIMACMWYQLSFYEEKYLDDNHSWMRHKLEGIIMAQSREERGFGDPTVDDDYSPGMEKMTEHATLDEYTCSSLDSNNGIKLVSTNECFTQFRQYLLSLYAVMMILVQDGVDPTTEIECLFAITFGMFGMVVGAVLVGQTAGKKRRRNGRQRRYPHSNPFVFAFVSPRFPSLRFATDIIGNLHRSETRYRNKLDDVTEQLKNLEISGQTRRRVFEYLDFIWTVNKGLNRERILGELR